MVTDSAPDGAPGRMTKAERAVAEGAILAAYSRAGIDSEDGATWGAPPSEAPMLPDVLAELDGKPLWRRAAAGALGR